jgi:hypothetical protein
MAEEKNTNESIVELALAKLNRDRPKIRESLSSVKQPTVNEDLNGENLGNPVMPAGITVEDVLRIFPGAQVIEMPIGEPKPSFCLHCNKESVPLWRRGGKIIQRIEPDGARIWTCHYCGHRCDSEKKSSGNRGTKRGQ